jgi:anti-sigma B factor antagonist
VSETEERFNVDIDVEQQHVRMKGVLDMATSPMMLDRVHILRRGETITLDLRRVTFMDAAGIGAIVRLRNDLLTAGGTLNIVGVHPAHARLFLICGLSSMLQGEPPDDIPATRR